MSRTEEKMGGTKHVAKKQYTKLTMQSIAYYAGSTVSAPLAKFLRYVVRRAGQCLDFVRLLFLLDAVVLKHSSYIIPVTISFLP